jgi:hypothetical protein
MNNPARHSRSRLLPALTLIVFAALPARAGDSPAAAGTVAARQLHPLPTLHFNGDQVTGDLYDVLRNDHQFENLSREAVGSPLELRAYHTYRIGRAAATATGFLAALTLGLVPTVSSGSHAVVYEVLVNGEVLSSYRYDTDITRVKSLWTQDTTNGLGEDGIKWVRSTAERFLNDAAEDPKLDALRSEFEYYFGPTAAK